MIYCNYCISSIIWCSFFEVCANKEVGETNSDLSLFSVVPRRLRPHSVSMTLDEWWTGVNCYNYRDMLKSIGFRALNLCCYTTSSIAKNLPSSRVLFRPFSNTTPCPKFKMDFLNTTASTLPMRPTSRIHKEYDISAEISFIENELHSADDIREVVTKQVLHTRPRYCAARLALQHGTLYYRSDLCSPIFQRYCLGCVLGRPLVSTICWLRPKPCCSR